MTAEGVMVTMIEDHPLLAAGLQGALLAQGADVACLVATADDVPSDLVAWVGAQRTQAVLVDLGLPFEGGGLALIQPLAASGVPVVVLTGETDDALLASCVGRGAALVLSKTEPLDAIVHAVLHVAAGGRVRQHERAALARRHQQYAATASERLACFAQLSGRERQVLAGLMAGHGVAQIATRDFVSVETVRTQVKSVLRKLRANTQLEAVALAHEANWSLDEQAEVGR